MCSINCVFDEKYFLLISFKVLLHKRFCRWYSNSATWSSNNVYFYHSFPSFHITLLYRIYFALRALLCSFYLFSGIILI